MIRVRSGITEEIRGKFYKSTIDKLYSREKNFNDIEDAISAARDLNKEITKPEHLLEDAIQKKIE